MKKKRESTPHMQFNNRHLHMWSANSRQNKKKRKNNVNICKNTFTNSPFSFRAQKISTFHGDLYNILNVSV